MSISRRALIAGASAITAVGSSGICAAAAPAPFKLPDYREQFCPWIKPCDGRHLPIAEYFELFGVLGWSYTERRKRGSHRQTFGIPLHEMLVAPPGGRSLRYWIVVKTSPEIAHPVGSMLLLGA